ncbi:MAG: glycosyltransferase, partial [Actinomycetota bacterium]|nr:glycosyltransferase [Actinomycetota bacterium]
MEDQYPLFLRNNRPRPSDLTRLGYEVSAFGRGPKITILLPIFEPEQLGETLDSVLRQAYPNWELCVACKASDGERVGRILGERDVLEGRLEVAYRDAGAAGLSNAALSLATGEFAGVLGCGDKLAPEALFEVAKSLRDRPDAVLVYTDEDKIDGEGRRSQPHFKPGWSPDLLLAADYVSSLSVYRRSFLEKAGGFREELEGAHGHDLALRATEDPGSIHHLPGVLYHRRTPSGPDSGWSKEHARQAVAEALERRGLEGSVEDGLLPDRFRVRYEVAGRPLVSIVIPTRDNVSMLKNCVESIERLTTYTNYEILIVDNDSVDPETVEYLASTPHRVERFREEFNYSRINNFAVARARGEYVLLLNDDTEVISGGWLEAMLE